MKRQRLSANSDPLFRNSGATARMYAMLLQEPRTVGQLAEAVYGDDSYEMRRRVSSLMNRLRMAGMVRPSDPLWSVVKEKEPGV